MVDLQMEMDMDCVAKLTEDQRIAFLKAFSRLAAADAALLNQTVARNHDEKLPLRVVPVLTLCDAGLRDVDAELAATLGFEQLGKAAAGVLVLFQVKDDLLFGQIGQIRRVQLFCKAARRNLRQYERCGLSLEPFQQVHNFAQCDFVGHRRGTVAPTVMENRRQTVSTMLT